MARLAISSYKASWYPGSNRARLVPQPPVYLEDDGGVVHERAIG